MGTSSHIRLNRDAPLAQVVTLETASNHSDHGVQAIVGQLLKTTLLLAVTAMIFSSPAFAGCDTIPAGKSFWVRLQDPVASYSSKPGTPVRAILIQSPECDSNPVFPAGLEVDGEITSVRKVGLGFIHDSATVEIRFSHIVTAAG